MAVSTRQALLQALSAAGGSYVSGQQLAETLGEWKRFSKCFLF